MFLPAQNTKVSTDLKAGLTFARLNGPSEKTVFGRSLEDFEYNTGFHAAVGINVPFSNHTAIQIELMYDQQGTEYSYSGQSYWFFTSTTGEQIFSFGTRKTELSIANTYLELPILYCIRANRVEISIGGSLGVLVFSHGEGKFFYTGTSESGSSINPFEVKLDFNYLKDPIQRMPVTEHFFRTLDGQLVEIPRAMGAYYESSGNKVRKFQRLNTQIISSISFFLTDELYLGLRLNYGITDITNTQQDAALQQVNKDKSLIFRKDKDRSLAFLASVGLRF